MLRKLAETLKGEEEEKKENENETEKIVEDYKGKRGDEVRKKEEEADDLAVYRIDDWMK